jgi:hypothetical protein
MMILMVLFQIIADAFNKVTGRNKDEKKTAECESNQ